MSPGSQSDLRSGRRGAGSWDVHRVEDALRASASGERDSVSGRLRARVVRAIAADRSAVHAATPSAWWNWARAAACAAGLVLCLVSAMWLLRSQAAPVIEPLRLSAEISPSPLQSAPAKMIRGLELPLHVEARRLRADVERGLRFVNAVMPRVPPSERGGASDESM